MTRIPVPITDRPYDVWVGPGSRMRLADELGKPRFESQPFVITDDTVNSLHREALVRALPHEPLFAVVPPGEASKCLEHAANLFSALAARQVDRDGVIVAFGGGVVGDLAGFVAATWLRGVRWIQVPTTLEAAIDASVGGKTAVNLPAGKNLVGAFHQPAVVLVDTDFLGTLPDREYRAALAESVKHAAIRDPAFFAWLESAAGAILERERNTLIDFISTNVRIKADVVVRDEREANLRAILNYGHTVGHAIEHVFEFALRHGECVGLGMIVENAIATARGMLNREEGDQIRNLLERLGLPIRVPGPIDADRVVAACRLDKKNRAGFIHAVVLRRLGEPVLINDVRPDEIAAALVAIH